jgi:hypothetical protein
MDEPKRVKPHIIMQIQAIRDMHLTATFKIELAPLLKGVAMFLIMLVFMFLHIQSVAQSCTGTLGGNSSPCVGTSSTYFIYNGASGCNVAFVSGGTAIGNTITWNSSGNRTIDFQCSCGIVSKSVTVYASGVNAGTTSLNKNPICTNEPGVTASVSGTSSIVRWERKLNGESTWTSIAHTTSTLPSNFISSTTEGDYRAYFQNVICGGNGYSTPVHLTISSLQTFLIAASTYTICSTSSATTLHLRNYAGITDTESGVVYSLYRDNVLYQGTGLPQPGGPGRVEWVNINQGGSYSVKATKNGNCETPMISSVYIESISPPNTGLAVSAQSGTICSGTSTVIQVANSEVDVNYQLRNNSNNSPIGSAVPGTGATINLPTGSLTTNSTFNVLALHSPCSAQLTSVATVTVAANGVNTGTTSLSKSSICPNEPNITATVSGTSQIVRWERKLTEEFSWTNLPHTTSTLPSSYINTTVEGDYRAYFVNPICGSYGYSTTTRLTIVPLQTFLIAASTYTLCSSTNTTTLHLRTYSGSTITESGVIYTLYKDNALYQGTGLPQVGGPGRVEWVNIDQGGSYSVKATKNGNCETPMISSVYIQSISAPVISNPITSTCSASTPYQFSITTLPNVTYTWTAIGSAGNPGTISSTGLMTWNSGYDGNATISVSPVNCPALKHEITVQVSLSPPTPVAINQTYCNWEFVQIKPILDGNTAGFNFYTGQDAFITTGFELQVGRKLNPGTYNYKLEALSAANCVSPAKSSIVLTITDDCESKLNWIETSSFDNNSQVVGQSKSYFDYAGRSLQSQSKHFSTGRIFTSGVVKDQYDRVIATSLAAPTAYGNFKYDIRFMLDATGNDIVNAADLDAPQAFDESSMGRLGWYYSVANTLEDYLPKSKYPYTRTKYYEDGSGEVMMTARPGEHHILGSNHESLSGTFAVLNELDDYLLIRNTHVLPAQTSYTTLKQGGFQRVIRDENGNYAISISDKSGKTLMTARPGNWVTISNVVTLKRGDPLFMDRLYFYLLKPGIVTLTPSGTPPAYSATNIISDQPFTIPPANSNWPAGFYRIDITSGTLGVAFSNSYEDIAYTFYDDASRMVSSISPNGYKQLKLNSPAVSYANIDKTMYTYNHRGWLLSMTEPDAGRTEYVYRSDGKIRFSQNALQRTQNRFSYTHYDELIRPVESGEYIGTSVAFKSVAMNSLIEVPANAITWNINDTKDWIRTHYDQPVSAGILPTGYNQTFLIGAVSWTESKSTSTYYSYDEFGRATWMWQKPKPITIPGGSNLSIGKSFLSTYQYNFLGNVLSVGNFTVDGSGSVSSTGKFYHHYEYDADQRLFKAYTSLDGLKRKLRASYTYYTHGPLKRVELGDQLQGIDFVYNIHGWLVSINHPEQTSDPGGDGVINSANSNFKKDAFGMILDYYESSMSGLFQIVANDQKMNPTRFHKLPLLAINAEKPIEINNQYTELMGSLAQMKAEYNLKSN